MPSAIDDEARLENALLTTPSLVDLPAEWKPHVDPPSKASLMSDEGRRFTRFPYRTRAIIDLKSSFPALPRAAARHGIYTKDISREGLGFYHAEQLYPREKFQVWLPRGGVRTVQVTRCSKLKDRCYEVGVRFV